MKKYIKRNDFSLKFVGLLLLMAFSVTLFGQRHTDRASNIERIKAQRVAFISEKMSLTPDEAQKLWPVLNKFHDMRKDLMNEYRNQWPRNLNVANLSDEEAIKYAEFQVLHIEKSARLARNLHEELKIILPPKKLALLYEAEEEFNRKLVRDRIQRGHSNQ